MKKIVINADVGVTMTPFKFKKKLLELGFKTQQQAADALGVRQQAISNWCTGRRAVPAVIEILIQCIEKAGETGREA